MPRLLFYGCTGNDVVALKFWLNYIADNKKPSYFDDLNLKDKKFDFLTSRRVVEFQWQSHMETKDGVVGPKTRQAIADMAGIPLGADGSLPAVQVSPASYNSEEPEYVPRHHHDY